MKEALNRRLFRKAFLVVVLVAIAAPALSDELEPVQRDVLELSQAMYRGDIDTILRFSHPKAIEMLGGPTAARATLEKAIQPILDIGMMLQAFSFPQPPEYIQGEERRFTIVPTLSIIAAQGQRIESLNYQFGILEPGAKGWTYLEGSRINQQNVRGFFPDFPADYVFPEFYRKRL